MAVAAEGALLALAGACVVAGATVVLELIASTTTSRRRRAVASLRLKGSERESVADWELRALGALAQVAQHPTFGQGILMVGRLVGVRDTEAALVVRVGLCDDGAAHDWMRGAKSTAACFAVLVGLSTLTSLGWVLLPALMGCAALGSNLPRLLLSRVMTRKVHRCVSELPDMIDMIAMASEAGLSFDAAVRLYVERTEGTLRDELALAADAMTTGAMSKEVALLRLAAALESEPVDRFVTTVIQSHRMGSPLSKELKTLAADARGAYRAQLEERIAKAPVKMLLPMGTLILPAMLLLIIGPVVAGMSSGFSV